MSDKLYKALTFIFEFPFIYSYFFPICVGIYLWSKKVLSTPAKLLLVYCFVIFLLEYANGFFAILIGNNLWVGRISVFIEIAFVYFFYRAIVQLPVVRNVLNLITAIALLFVIYLNLESIWTTHNELEVVIYYAYLFLVVIFYFIETFRTKAVPYLFKDIGFLVGSTLILSNSIVLLHFLFFNTTLTSNNEEMLAIHYFFETLNLYTIVSYNCLFALILWVTRIYRR